MAVGRPPCDPQPVTRAVCGGELLFGKEGFWSGEEDVEENGRKKKKKKRKKGEEGRPGLLGAVGWSVYVRVCGGGVVLSPFSKEAAFDNFHFSSKFGDFCPVLLGSSWPPLLGGVHVETINNKGSLPS